MKKEIVIYLEQVMQFVEKKGDLFKSSDSLVHCVSLDFKMGAGIALYFKQKFGKVDELKLQNRKIGECANIKDDDRRIFYLITKNRYFEKPTISNLQKTLEYLKEECEKYEITNLSMPKIGCGLDKLNWKDVKQVIKKTFENTKIKVTIYSI